MCNLTDAGISIKDWQKLQCLVQDYVEMTNYIAEEKQRIKIIVYLNKLHKLYGDKASILATKADYVKKYHHKKQLLEHAYTIAINHQDNKNLVLISSSF